MLPIHYTYLIGASFFIFPWTIIFILRPDLRQLMIRIGLLSVVIALICEYFWWTRDWWKPFTVTGTVIGIEDVIHSFFGGGVAASLYMALFRKRFSKVHSNSAKHVIRFWIFAGAGIVLFATLFSLGLNSFISTLIVAVTVSTALLISSHKLVVPAIISGLLMMLMVVPAYLIMLYLTPGFVSNTWMKQNMIGYYVIGVPIEDFIFYFVVGLMCFSAKIYYMNSTLVNFSSRPARKISKSP